MPPTLAQLQAVLEAARRLLAAREDQMVTAAEWDDLARAVAACDEPERPGAPA